MKKRDRMSRRHFNRLVKSGWESMAPGEITLHNRVINGKSAVKEPIWLNCAGVILFLGLSLILILTDGTSPFSPALNEIGPLDLISRLYELIS